MSAGEFLCRSCAHSEIVLAWRGLVLACAVTGLPARQRCERFVYEPGTDEHA